jgi:cytochrome c556
MSTSSFEQQSQYARQSAENAQEQATRLQNELNQAIQQTSTVLARYVREIRPNSTPFTAEIIAVANAKLQQTAMSLFSQVDPQTGRLNKHALEQTSPEVWRQLAQWQTRSNQQQQGQSPNGQRSRGRNRSRAPQFVIPVG